MSPRRPRVITSTEEKTLEVGDTTCISDSGEIHHLRTVLRKKCGDKIELFDSKSSQAFLTRITTLTENTLELYLERALPQQVKPGIHLVVGITRPRISDFIVEKSVEVGAKAVSFYFAKRSQRRLTGREQDSRLARLSRVRDAATKQSSASTTLDLEIFHDLEHALMALHPKEYSAQGLKLLCRVPENATQQTKQVPLITEVITSQPTLNKTQDSDTSYPVENISQPADSYILVGPEGGLHREELSLAERFEYESVSLGPNVLRTETAVIVASALVMLLRQTRS